jgi:hypothetical protein
METTRKQSTRRGVTKKYTLMLTGLQEVITLNEVKAIAPIIRSYRVSNSWGAFLIQNNIIFRDIHDNYKWNNKTPISNKLIQAFRDYKRKVNEDCYSTKGFPETINNSNLINEKFDCTELKKTRPGSKKKVIVIEKQEIGLIRKFLKWIY